MKRLITLLAFAGMSLAPSLSGAIINPGFEADSVTDGNFLHTVTGWTPTVGCCGVAIANPTTSWYASGNSFEGNNFAYGNGGGHGYFQVLPDVFAANTTYTFGMMVGHRLDLGFPGSLLEIRAGSFFSTFLASSTDFTDPGSGQWQFRSVKYTTGSTGAEIGQQIVVSFGSLGIQTNFDAAELTSSSSVPEPATCGLIGVSLFTIQQLRRRRR